MKDRVPKYPGRVTLVPVAGQENTFDMVRADEPTQSGDPLNKNTLLKDATASLFGMGADAVPDDVLAFLGKYNQHWWKRRGVSGRYEKVVTAVTDGTYRWVFNSSNGIVYSYSDSVSISTTGVVSLGGTVKTFTAANVSEFNTNSAVLVGRYFTASKEVRSVNNSEVCLAVGTVYYIPSGATFNQYSNGQYTSVTALSKVTSEYTETIGDWEYLLSSDRNAYPDSGVSDGYEWQYLGVPFDNAVTAPNIVTGSYVGTGKYGSNNKNSINLGFNPKFFFVLKDTNGSTHVDNGLRSHGFFVEGMATLTYFFSAGSPYARPCSVSNGVISWYCDQQEPDFQLNTKSKTHYYIAIG